MSSQFQSFSDKEFVENLDKDNISGGTKKGEAYVKDINSFSPLDGENRIRLLPPMKQWGDEQNPQTDKFSNPIGLEVYRYYINHRYWLSPRTLGMHDVDPFLQEKMKWKEKGDEANSKRFGGQRRVIAWVFDMNNYEELTANTGINIEFMQKVIKLWSMPYQTFQQLCTMTTDARTGAVVKFNDLAKGCNIHFVKSGTGIATRYQGFQFGEEFGVEVEEALQLIKPFEQVLDIPTPQDAREAIAQEWETIGSDNSQPAPQQAAPQPSYTPQQSISNPAPATNAFGGLGDSTGGPTPVSNTSGANSLRERVNRRMEEHRQNAGNQ